MNSKLGKRMNDARKKVGEEIFNHATKMAAQEIFNSATKAGQDVFNSLTTHSKKQTPPLAVYPPLDSSIEEPKVDKFLPDSPIEEAKVEKFLKDIAREKPMRFTPHQLEEFTDNFSTKLGSGGFGVVYGGAFPDGVQMAVKVLNGNSDKSVEEQFMAEISTIGRTYHINLVRLYGFCFDVSIRALVYEYMENGSLDMFLFRKNPRIEWEKLPVIAIGTAKGIAYLHEECEQRIIHYDIKPGNVLLDRNFSPRVADFGLAKLCDRDRTHMTMTGGRGTPGYAAPELFEMSLPITHKCDVYSFGIMLFEIVGRRRNLDADLSESQKWFPRLVWKKFEDGELEEMIASFEMEEGNRESMERMAMVALWCIQYLPKSRPSMSSVVKMLEGGSEILRPPNPFRHSSPLDWKPIFDNYLPETRGSEVLRSPNPFQPGDATDASRSECRDIGNGSKPIFDEYLPETRGSEVLRPPSPLQRMVATDASRPGCRDIGNGSKPIFDEYLSEGESEILAQPNPFLFASAITDKKNKTFCWICW